MGRKIFWAVALSIALLFPFQAWRLYPLQESDALWFLPPAVNYAQHQGLINNLHLNAAVYDVTGRHLFAFYPPGFPWLLGLLAPEPSPRGVYFVLGLICGLTVLLSAFLLDRIIRQRSPLSPGASWGLGILGLLALGTYESSYCLGRPDFLATLLILAGWMAVRRTDRFSWVWAGLCLGLTAFVQPVAALMTAGLLGLYWAWRHDLKTVVRKIVPAYILGLLLLALLFTVSPNGWSVYLSGISHHANSTLVNGTWDDPHKDQPLKYLVWHSYATGYGFLFLLGVGLGARAFFAKSGKPESGFASSLFIVAIALLVFHFVIQAWDRAYNLWLFTPLLILILFRFGFEYLKELSYPDLRKMLLAVLIAVMAVASMGFLHRTLLFTNYLQETETAAVAQPKIEALLTAHPRGTVGVSKSLWVFFGDYTRIASFGLHAQDLGHPTYVILQQRYTRHPTPPELKGYQLLYENFDPRGATFLGIPLSPTRSSYRFAFYESTEPEWLLWK